jgi:hypothetical protein
MTDLLALWLPTLTSAIAVWMASSVVHMMLPWHKTDYGKVPSEDLVRDALRPFAIPPGDYMVPRPSSVDDLKSPAFRDKANAGPVMGLTVMPNGMMSMARNLSLWFAYCVAVSICAAYVAGRALPVGSPYLSVFRFVGATAFIGYSMALWQMSIWYRRKWSTTFKANVDGLIYALLTAGFFGWLWPR